VTASCGHACARRAILPRSGACSHKRRAWRQLTSRRRAILVQPPLLEFVNRNARRARHARQLRGLRAHHRRLRARLVAVPPRRLAVGGEGPA
jgi:hypothetical protein